MQNFKNAQVLVIIVTYNAMQWAEKCLGSIHASTVVPDVFVIDNGSMDGTQAFIKELYPKVIFHQSEENIGFGKANNVGLQYALDHNYDYVYLLNQDAWILPDTIGTLISTHKKHPQFGILSPIQMQANQIRLDYNFRMGVCSIKSNKDLHHDIINNMFNYDVYEVPRVMAAHWLISLSCIKSVGGFSPIFYHYSEDDNYADRCRYWGFCIGVVPSAKAVHDREYRKNSKQKAIYLAYTYSLASLCNPRYTIKSTIVYLLFFQLRIAFVTKTIKPITNVIKLLSKYPMILKMRKDSRKMGAFLTSCS